MARRWSSLHLGADTAHQPVIRAPHREEPDVTLTVGLLRRITGWCLRSTQAVPGVGQRIEAGEQEAAQRRLLDQARGAERHPTAHGGPLDHDPDRFAGHDE